MRYTGILLLAVLVAGCDPGVYGNWSQEKTAGVADAADANARTALMRHEELEERVSDLETQNTRLAAELESLRSTIDSLESEYRAHEHEARHQ